MQSEAQKQKSQNGFISFLKKHLFSFHFIFGLYTVITIAATLIQYFQGRVNNFLIFKYASIHFFERLNMFIPYPELHHDLFLYNPSFALLFSPFAYLPNWLGMLTWSLLVVSVFLFSIYLMPIDKKAKVFVYYFVLMAIVPCIQSFQTNPLILAFILLPFAYIEREKYFKAALFPVIGFFIKGYGAVSGVFFLLKKPKIKTFIQLGFWFIVFLILPLLYYSPKNLFLLYQQWGESLNKHFVIFHGSSIIDMVNSITSQEIPAIYYQIVGVILLLTTIIYFSVTNKYESFKYEFLAYITIWVIIFNHAAESNTFIISQVGIAIWYTQSAKTRLETSLIIFVFIFTVLSTTDVFPKFIRNNYIYPYSIKALGPTLVFIWLQIKFFKTPYKQIIDETQLPIDNHTSNL